MSTIVIFLAALLACSLLAGWLIKVRSRRRQLPWTNAFADAQTRKLTPEERSAVENYLESLTQDYRCLAQRELARHRSLWR
ncbi:IgaA/UmoB family intracellular growth attenuator [Shigella flexneri]